MLKLTIQQRVILHLGNYKNALEKRTASYAISQEGIAKAVQGSRSHISRVLREMKEDGLIKETRKYLEKNQKRKRKVYFLSSEGVEKEKKLRKELKEEMITVKTEKGKDEVRLDNLGKYINNKDPILYASINIKEGKVLDLTKDEKEFSFVNREEELKRLEKKLKNVKENGCSSIFIIGEAGSGKTSLIKEFKKSAIEKGFDFLRGKSYSKPSDPYLPLKKAFEDFSEKEEITSPLSILEGRSNEKRVTEDENSFDAKRQSVFFEFTNEIRKIVNETPLVIFLDDLQWADSATLHLLNYMIDNLSENPIFFIGAYRSESITDDHPIKDISNRMSRTGKYSEMILKPLDWKYIREIIHSIIGATNSPSDFVNFIYDITEGNPLFAREFLELLMEENKLPSDTSDYPTREEEIDTPNVIEKLLQRRFDIQLSNDAQKIASLGSIIGEKIPFELLERCSEKTELKLLDLIDELITKEIWEERPENESFIFSHKLLRNVIYDNISTMKRKRLHEIIAENMEKLYQEQIKDYHSDIGYHYQNAGNNQKAIEHLLKAGKEAERVYAHENAINLYKTALDLSGGQKRLKILKKIGIVYKFIGEYSEAVDCFNNLIDEAEDVKLQQKTLGELGETYTKQGKYQESLQAIERGLSLRDEEDVSKCDLLHAKGWVHFRKGDYKKARDIFKEERNVAESLGNEKAIAQALHNLGTVALQEGKYDRAEKLMKEVVEVREDMDDKIGLGKSLNNLGNIHYLKGDFDKAQKNHERSLEIRKEIDDQSGIASSLNNLALIFVAQGKLDEALQYHKKSLHIKEKVGDKSGIAESLNNLGIIYENKGNLEKALDFFERGMDIEKKIGDKDDIATSLNNIGNIYYKKGEIHDALKKYKESLEINENIGNKLGSIPPKEGIAKANIELGEYDRSVKYGKDALELCEEIGAKSEKGVAHKVLGQVYREFGELEKAEKQFKRCLDVLNNFGNESDYYKALFEYSLFLEEKGAHDDAKEYLNSALSYFQKNGMDFWMKKCENVLKELKK